MFDFPVDIEDLTPVPEQFQPLYEAGDAGFRLVPELAAKLDVSGLRSALEKERKSAQRATRELAAWRQLAPDPESARARQSAAAEAQMRIEELQAQNHQDLKTHKATEAVLKGRGSPELLLPHLEAALTLVEEAGAPVLRVLASDGSLRETTEGELMTADDLLEEFRGSPVFARAFDPLVRRGSGMDPASGSSTGSHTGGGEISGRSQWALNTRLEDIAAGKVTLLG
ncbi:hypothetical protein NBZ79_12205 [Sneathiella marina]|uniref:Flagellar assembly protein FliH/Type III secretion system HrpE domain-containing protein n=1 Tax=Sneathiella marina TaxID=2950108 RepID=A0ABY4VZC2_9PROT|nr:hypothetical protein [Sneathiella marina]USG59939.1 hypothetical protein NBZ79_12205 [Sneathiella marina]